VGWARDRIEDIWYPEPGTPKQQLLDIALSPLEWIYKLGLALRAHPRKKALQNGQTVMAIGNLTVGGSGKTPLTLALAERWVAAGRRVAVLSRGYGRISHGPQVVHLPGGEFADVAVAGDEPLLLARRCPACAVVVGEKRLEAAALATRLWNPQVLILDDAFQHQDISRDYNILAVHAQRGFGNCRMLPRGPLREPLSALRRASLVVFTHVHEESLEELRLRLNIPNELPAVRVKFVPEGFSVGATLESAVYDTTRGPVLAMCAVADPQGFLATCRKAGLTVARILTFPDHYRVTDAELTRIAGIARGCGAQAIIVTEKDLVRLGPVPGWSVFGLRITARFLDEDVYPGLHAGLYGITIRA
jgi:tetraacyldisaccharide 4'-kinase